MNSIDKALDDIRLASVNCSDECQNKINASHKYDNPKLLSKNIIELIDKSRRQNEK